jgi:hypothetical protein
VAPSAEAPSGGGGAGGHWTAAAGGAHRGQAQLRSSGAGGRAGRAPARAGDVSTAGSTETLGAGSKRKAMYDTLFSPRAAKFAQTVGAGGAGAEGARGKRPAYNKEEIEQHLVAHLPP